MLQRAERPAALVVIEVDPVAGALASSAITHEPCLRGLSPWMLASRSSSPMRLPFGKWDGTQASAVARSPATTASRS